MTAIQWLATQLAWEQRLVELRGDGTAAETPAVHEIREAA